MNHPLQGLLIAQFFGAFNDNTWKLFVALPAIESIKAQVGDAGGLGDGDGGSQMAGGAARQAAGPEARARSQAVERSGRGPLAYRALPSGSLPPGQGK